MARVEGLEWQRLVPGGVLGGGGSALGPLAGSCRAGLLWFQHFKFGVVCRLSLMDKLALLMLLKSAVAIQVGSGSW